MAAKLLLLSLLISKLLMFTDSEPIGVCYGQIGTGLPSEQDVVNMYKRNGITRMRIYFPTDAILGALGGSNIELVLGVPNEDIESLTDLNTASNWVRSNILRYPNVNFRYIVVGNEIGPDNDNRHIVNFVLPAMKNVQKAITDARLANKIKVSTATYTGLLSVSYPPSAGEFSSNAQGFIKPIIKFLVENNSPMFVNINPYFAYVNTPNIDLSYALFTSTKTVVNDNGRKYSNLFDAMLDAHYAAISRLDKTPPPEIKGGESGWSSHPGRGDMENAETFYRNLIAHVNQTTGTPARPGRCIETYLFAAFDENQKKGAESEKHYGIFKTNTQPKYNLRFN